MTKSFRTRIEALIQEHGAYRIKDAVQSALGADRDALRALGLDDCYSLELQQILDMVNGNQSYDAAAALKEMFG